MFSLSVEMEWHTVKCFRSCARYLHVKVQPSSWHTIVPVAGDWSWWCFCTCLNKLALCTYVLLQDVQDRLGGVISVDCGGFLLHVAFVLGLVCPEIL